MSSGGASARRHPRFFHELLDRRPHRLPDLILVHLPSTVFPVATSRPITVAARLVGDGNAEPIATFSSSADFSPIETP